MWPFKKKKSGDGELDWRKKAIEELKEFRAIGDRFTYLGVEMIVYAHHESYISPYFSTYLPCLKANYVNKHGEIKNADFSYSELHTLKNENL